MARQFVIASSMGFYVDSTFGITGPPFTLACWFNPVDITSPHAMMWLGNSGVNTTYHYLAALGSTAGDPIAASSRASTNYQATTSTGFVAGAWQHACGVWRGTADRSAYLNGGGRGNNTGSIAPTGINRLSIGYVARPTPADYAGAAVAHCAAWKDVALSDTEVLALALGVCPLYVRPSNLVAYFPLGGMEIGEREYTSRYPLTTVNGPTRADDPPQVWQPRRRLVLPLASAPDSHVAQKLSYYRRMRAA